MCLIPVPTNIDFIWKYGIYIYNQISMKAGPNPVWLSFIRRDKETHREDGHVTIETETEEMHLYKPKDAKNCQQMPEARRGQENSSL